MAQENASDGPNKKVSFSAQLMDRLEREGAINRYRDAYEALPGEDADKLCAPDPYPYDPRRIAKCYADLFSILVKGFPEISTDESFSQLQTLYFHAGALPGKQAKIEDLLREKKDLVTALNKSSEQAEEFMHLMDMHKEAHKEDVRELSDALYNLVAAINNSSMFFLRRDIKAAVARATILLNTHRVRSVLK